MSLKIVFALVSAAMLCCAQTDTTSSSGFPAKETATPASAPPAPTPAAPPANQAAPGAPETNQNGAASQAGPSPTIPAAPPDDQPAPSGKAEAGGRFAGAKPDTGHKAYVIGPLDVLGIKVWNNQNLTGTVDVGPDGMITMPLIGEIKAAGLTERQLKDAISERLRDFFNNNPDVVVQVLKNNSKRYFVYGGVLRGGEFPLNRDTTVMDALALVGGFKEFSNKKKIRIMRGAKEFLFNYEEVSRGRNLKQNILLEPGDQIFVKE